jgi:hypothetical protein
MRMISDRTRNIWGAALAVALVAMGTGQARADLSPAPPTTGPGIGGTTLYTYSITLSSNSQLIDTDPRTAYNPATGVQTANVGSYFTLYNVQGLVIDANLKIVSHATAGNWAIATLSPGVTPGAPITQVDHSGSFPNILVYYTGPGESTGALQVPGAVVFSFDSVAGPSPVNNTFFNWQTFNNQTPAGQQAGGSNIIGPSTVTPEPSSLALLGLGLPLGLLLRRKARKTS